MDDQDVPDVTKLLTAPELVALRKSEEDILPFKTGEKFKAFSNSSIEKDAVTSALESYQVTLEQKRTARFCDIISVEWNEEMKVCIAAKLKGKFVQHMGRSLNGKIALSPEESIFLLENDCIEILHKGLPLSTEDAYNIILTGNLGVEKYQVYSHLSQLGFIVVSHQLKCVTRYEKEMNLMNRILKRQRVKPVEAEEPKNKRLNFSGVFSDEPEIVNCDVSSSQITDYGLKNSHGNSDESSKHTEMEATEIQNEDTTVQKRSMAIDASKSIEHESSIILDNPDPCVQSVIEENNDVILPHSKNTVQHDYTEKILNTSSTCAIEPKSSENVNIDIEVSQKENVSVETIDNRVNTEVTNTESGNIDIAGNPQSTVRSESNGDLCIIVDSPFTDVSSKEDLDSSCSSKTSEINVNSLDSSCAAVTGSNECVIADTENFDSNLDILSCSSENANETEVLSVDESNHMPVPPVDDEIELIEVPKKEKEPLAVIDLLSDNDHSESGYSDQSDEEIRVVEICPKQSNRPTSNILRNSKNEFKIPTKANVKLQASSYQVLFPDLFRKDDVCIARPPLNLLPNHVKPAKEAYVLHLNPFNQSQTNGSQNRMWNSYHDLRQNQRFRRHPYTSNPNSRYSHRPSMKDMNFNTRNEYQSFNSGRNGSVRHFPGNYDISRPRGTYHGLPCPNPQSCLGGITTRSDTNSQAGTMHFIPSVPHESEMRSLGSMNPSNPFMQPGPNDPYIPPHLMEVVQTTAYRVASNMLSTMLGPGYMGAQNNASSSHFSQSQNNRSFSACGLNSPSGFNIDNSFGRNRFGYSNSSSNPRPYRIPSFPCDYQGARNRQSWNDIREAVRPPSPADTGSDIEEVPINPIDVLWDSKGVCPLVKPGTKYPITDILKSLQVTQNAKLIHKFSINEKCLPTTSSLEISFDVYLPGSHFKKTCPDIPKHRVIIVRSSDPMPKYSELVVLQRKWTDGATIQIAVVDNGDISFFSLTSTSLPVLIPHHD